MYHFKQNIHRVTEHARAHYTELAKQSTIDRACPTERNTQSMPNKAQYACQTEHKKQNIPNRAQYTEHAQQSTIHRLFVEHAKQDSKNQTAEHTKHSTIHR